MKYLLVTDTHLGINQSSELYHEVVYNLFKEITQYCHDSGIDTIIHLGDFFHERKSLNTKTQHIAHKIAKELNGIRVYIIVGNHDIYYRDKLIPTSLELFKNYSNINIIDKVTEIEDGIVLSPWRDIPRGYRGGYCFGHFDFIGFKMNNSYVCERGTDPNEVLFNDFEHIYSGHFHTPSSRGKITYLGSPYQQTFADIGSERGYYVWEDGSLVFIPYTSAPVFMQIHTSQQVFDGISGNIVKLVFDDNYGTLENQKIVDNILLKKPLKLQVDFSQVDFEGTEDRIETAEASLLDHDGIIVEYVNKTETPSHLNKRVILKMMEELKDE